MKKRHIAFLSLGSNEGNKLIFLQDAIHQITDEIGDVLAISSIYKTASWGFEGNDFFNIIVKISTFQTASTVLKNGLKIEKKLGRERTKKTGYHNRNIDIDVILFNDEVIFSEKLTVPHPKMLTRKFVLVPLGELAKNMLHPIEKKPIKECLKNCVDTSEIIKIEEKLVRPKLISEKYKYIAIEGNIGAGKTTLAKMMSEDYNAKVVLERFADNPFLPKFYEDKERFAFPLEMSFLADRYQQITDDLAQFDLFKSFMISDYYIFKSLIFAQVTLQKEEYQLYRKVFDIMYKEITKPDLYVYIYQNTERLIENIKKRGRTYEQGIDPKYLQKIQEGYTSFIKTEQNLNTLIIDASELDFINNEKDYKFLTNLIKGYQLEKE